MKLALAAVLLLALAASYRLGKHNADQWYAQFPVIVTRYVYPVSTGTTSNGWQGCACWNSTSTTSSSGYPVIWLPYQATMQAEGKP